MDISTNETGIVINDKEKSSLIGAWILLGMTALYFSFKVYKLINNPTNNFALYTSLLFIIIPLIGFGFLLKKESKSEYQYSEIKSLNESKVFGKTVYSLKTLKGKTRKLPPIHNLDILDEIRNKIN